MKKILLFLFILFVLVWCAKSEDNLLESEIIINDEIIEIKKIENEPSL